MSEKITLRELTAADLPQIAEVHCDSFPEGAMTKLGRRVVEQYYLWQLTGPHTTVRAVGAFSGNDCAGFSFGGVFSGGSMSGFLRHNKSLLITQFLLHPHHAFSPFLLRRIITGVKILRRSARRTLEIAAENASAKPNPTAKIKSFGILSLAVAHRCQGCGIGQRLLADAETEAAKSGFEQMDLMVHPENLQAVRFYEKQNWEKVPAEDQWRGVMIKKIPKVFHAPKAEKTALAAIGV